MPEPRPRRTRSNNQWGMIAAVVVVLLVAGYLVWSAVGKKSSGATYITQNPTRGTLTVSVAGNGNVVSQSQASVNPSISGKVKGLSVSLGSKVKKGEVLFVIDNPALDSNVTQSKSSYQSSKSNTEKAEQAELQADVSLKTGVWQAAQALETAKAATYDAQQAYIAKPNSSTKHKLTAAKYAQQIAQKNYDHACELQEDGHSSSAEAYSAAVTAQSAAYQNWQQSIQNAGQRTVTSPIDGYITTLSINNGDQLGTSNTSSGGSSRSSSGGSSSSSSSSSGGAPIVISDLSALQAQVAISETDRPNVKLGQKVELTFDAVPNLTITGLVTQIDAVGTSSSGVVTYNVTISMDVQDKRLSPGMTASASIITHVDTNVLMVPNAAVKTDTSGNSFVQVTSAANGTNPTDVTVTTGPASDTSTEILSGLTGNENVVVQTISSSTSGSTSSRSGLSVLGGGGGGARFGGGGGFRGGN